MARITKTRKPEALPTTPLESMMRDHLHALAVQNYSAHNRRIRHRRFQRSLVPGGGVLLAGRQRSGRERWPDLLLLCA
jgi:ribosomal protein L4